LKDSPAAHGLHVVVVVAGCVVVGASTQRALAVPQSTPTLPRGAHMSPSAPPHTGSNGTAVVGAVQLLVVLAW